MAKFKKMWEVLSNKPRLKGVHHQGQDYKFSKSGVFHISDGAIAKDLREQVGQDSLVDDIMVIPVDNWDNDPTGIHRGSWGLQRLPNNWKDKIDWGD